MKYYAAIDLGGTNIKSGIVAENGEILSKASIPTGADREPSLIVKDMAKALELAAEKAGMSLDQVESIGIGCPGICDSENGILVYTNNIPFFNIDLRTDINRYLNKSIPLYIDNDANCAAWGEYLMNHRDKKSLVLITLGTGVGGGLVLNGQLYPGFNGSAFEIGHTSIVPNGLRCTCGRAGCLEQYASVTALIRQTAEIAEARPDTALAKKVKEDGKVTGKTAFDLARSGDWEGIEIVTQWINYVAEGIINAINVIQPEIVLIGGAISREGDFLLAPIKKRMKYDVFTAEGVAKTELGIAALGNDAGLIGAAFLGRN